MQNKSEIQRISESILSLLLCTKKISESVNQNYQKDSDLYIRYTLI